MKRVTIIATIILLVLLPLTSGVAAPEGDNPQLSPICNLLLGGKAKAYFIIMNLPKP